MDSGDRFTNRVFSAREVTGAYEVHIWASVFLQHWKPG